MIEVEGLTYTYPTGRRPALQELSLRIPEGQFCAVVGPNGAGKSTLCRALTGFVPHFFRGELNGAVRLEGAVISGLPPEALVGTVGFVFDDPFHQITGARFTVREEIAFGLENLGVDRAEMQLRVERVLADSGLGELAERSPYGLSGGQQQRLAIAAILAMEPRLLVLDEPTSQLDPAGSQQVLSALEQLTQTRKTTIVLVEQKLEWLASQVDRVLMLVDGRLVADGSAREVLGSEAGWSGGVRQTRFTQAARRARETQLAPSDSPLPVTLEEAVAFFS
ncbi:MAG: energy-coupling factor ABC transporter ATP-binding protein [Anaerolineales bacterium]